MKNSFAGGGRAAEKNVMGEGLEKEASLTEGMFELRRPAGDWAPDGTFFDPVTRTPK